MPTTIHGFSKTNKKSSLNKAVQNSEKLILTNCFKMRYFELDKKLTLYSITMPQRLEDCSLYKYRKFPPQVEVDKLCPTFQENLHALAIRVPEFGFWLETISDPNGKDQIVETEPSKRAQEQILALFYTDKKLTELLSARKIKGNLQAMIVSIRSRIRQLEDNFLWSSQRRAFEKQDNRRVQAERAVYAQGKKPFYQPRLARRSYVSSSTEDFRHSPANFAKLVQGIMVNPTNRHVIHDEAEARSSYVIQNQVVDPLLLTDRQLENLGITLPSGRRFSRVEKLTFRDDAIDKIKKELPVLREIGEWGNHDRFGRYRLYASKDGQVIGRTNVQKGRPSLYKASLWDACRSKEQTTRGYKPEAKGLQQIITMINGLDQQLSKEWQKVKNSEELEEAKAAILQAVDKLKHVRDEDKVAAKELLEKAALLGTMYCKTVEEAGTPPRKEWRLKLNPGATRAQLNTAMRKLKARLHKRIPRISNYVSNDQVILEQEMARHENIPFGELLEHLEKKKKPIRAGDNNKILPPNHINNIQSRLHKWRRLIIAPISKGPFLEPYNSFSERVCESIDLAITETLKDKCTVAQLKERLSLLHSYLKLYQIWVRWETLYDTHLGNDKMPRFIEFAKDLKRLRSIIAESPQNGIVQEAFTDFDKNAEDAILLCEEGRAAMRKKDQKNANTLRLALKRQMREVNITAQLHAAGVIKTSPDMQQDQPE